MSDLFYPTNVSGNKYISTILSYIPQSQYIVAADTDETTGILYQSTPPSATPTIKCRFPRYYLRHLERFLWRYYLFYGMYTYFHLKRKALNRTGVGFIERMLVLMDTVLDQLVVTCTDLGNELRPLTSVPYFDLYLVTEYLVGRHDPASVDAWRRNPNNINLDLERIVPHMLDWTRYDEALGIILSGRTYKGVVASVQGVTEWDRVLGAVGQWYGLSLRTTKKVTAKGDIGRLVNGTAGLGFLPEGLAMGDHAQNTEGATDPEMTAALTQAKATGKGKAKANERGCTKEMVSEQVSSKTKEKERERGKKKQDDKVQKKQKVTWKEKGKWRAGREKGVVVVQKATDKQTAEEERDVMVDMTMELTKAGGELQVDEYQRDDVMEDIAGPSTLPSGEGSANTSTSAVSMHTSWDMVQDAVVVDPLDF